MPRKGTEKENFQINKKEATVAEEFFPNLQAIGDPFSGIMHDSRRARTLNSPSVFQCHRDILWQRNDTNIKGKAADFFGRFYWPAGKPALQRMPLVKHLLCLHLSCSFILILKYSYISYFVF